MWHKTFCVDGLPFVEDHGRFTDPDLEKVVFALDRPDEKAFFKNAVINNFGKQRFQEVFGAGVLQFFDQRHWPADLYRSQALAPLLF